MNTRWKQMKLTILWDPECSIMCLTTASIFECPAKYTTPHKIPEQLLLAATRFSRAEHRLDKALIG